MSPSRSIGEGRGSGCRSVKSVIRLPNTLRNGRSRYSVCYPKTAFMASSVAQRKPRSNGSPMKLRIIKITSRRISFQESLLRSFTLLSESWSINIYIDVFGRLSKLLFCLFSPPPHQELTEKETRREREIEVDELDKLIGIFFRQRLASPASPLHHGAENLPPPPPRLSARIMFCWFRVLFTSAERAHRAKKSSSSSSAIFHEHRQRRCRVFSICFPIKRLKEHSTFASTLY